MENIFSGSKFLSPNNAENNFAFLIQEEGYILSPVVNVPKHFTTEIKQGPAPILKLPEKIMKKAKKEVQNQDPKPTKKEIMTKEMNIQVDYQREWKITKSTENIQVDITSKTRCEIPTPQVPEVLYSSLKYEIKQKISGNYSKEHQFLLGRISLVDSFGNSLGDKQLLKGLIECALTKTQLDEFEGTMKVQFSDVSYTHKKGDLSWQIQYYLPSDLENPVIVVLSAPFKIYARKPSVKKRKTSNFDEFTTRLEDLIKASKKLKNEEKKLALELASSKLRDLEPNQFKFEF